jgi:hypothetical protein
MKWTRICPALLLSLSRCGEHCSEVGALYEDEKFTSIVPANKARSQMWSLADGALVFCRKHQRTGALEMQGLFIIGSVACDWRKGNGDSRG